MEVENALGFQIGSASVSIPRIPAIYDEDIYDSFEYVGLEYLQVIRSYSMHGKLFTSGSSAALAGHGLAVCPNITHPETCREGKRLKDVYYVVDYSKSSLFAYHTRTFPEGAYDIYEVVEFDPRLGSDSIDDNPSPEYYWEGVRDLLLKCLLTWYYKIPSAVVIVGESAEIPAFRRVLNETLREFFKDDLPIFHDKDALYSQAKGVAEFMRRWQYRPKPWKPESSFSTDFQNPFVN